MTAIKYIDRLKQIDRLVRLRSTGSPNELAVKLGISERSVYDLLKDLRELGAPLAWDFYSNSYIYIEAGKLQIDFVTEPDISGGFYLQSQAINKNFYQNENLI